MDLLSLIRKVLLAPPFVTKELMDQFGAKVELPNVTFPSPSFATKRPDSKGRLMPQIIAHRGFKAVFPENSIQAFEAAIEAGAHAIETDVHLSKDNVVVLSHDADLKRCFGVDRRIRDCDWSYLETLRTIREPSQPLARLEDLLKLLMQPASEGIWIMLDIKRDDDPKLLMEQLAKTFKKVNSGISSQWKDRVVLGYWMAKFIPLCNEYFPNFPIANISFSPTYSRQFLDVPESGISMLQIPAMSPFNGSFIRDVQANHRQLYVWTVNDEKNMDWCIRRQVDGVITDDVLKFVDVCKNFDTNRRYSWRVKQLILYTYFNFWIFVFGVVFTRRHGTCIEKKGNNSKNR